MSVIKRYVKFSSLKCGLYIRYLRKKEIKIWGKITVYAQSVESMRLNRRLRIGLQQCIVVRGAVSILLTVMYAHFSQMRLPDLS